MPKYLSRTIQQIPLEQMARGLARPVATLILEPAEITSRSGLTFEAAHDDLDELQAAVFRVATGQEFALVRHRHQPQPGTDILINETSRDLGAALRDALQGLQLEPRELRWTHPKIEVTKLKRSPDVGNKAAEIQKTIELTPKSSRAIRPAVRELYIEQRPDGTYAVRWGGAQRASAIKPTQSKAIEWAKEHHPDVHPRVERVRNTDKGGHDKRRKGR